MLKILFILLTYVSIKTAAAQPVTTVPGPYYPCQSWITFAIDDSIVIQNNDFTKYLTFLSSAIGNITHSERIAVVGIHSNPIPWNSGSTIRQIQDGVEGTTQFGAYSLRLQLTAILTNMQSAQINGDIPVSAIIFVPITSNYALQGVTNVFNQLKNVKITFVLLGKYPDQSKLTKYSSNFIYWTDLSKSQPDNWDNLNFSAYGCQ